MRAHHQPRHEARSACREDTYCSPGRVPTIEELVAELSTSTLVAELRRCAREERDTVGDCLETLVMRTSVEEELRRRGCTPVN